MVATRSSAIEPKAINEEEEEEEVELPDAFHLPFVNHYACELVPRAKKWHAHALHIHCVFTNGRWNASGIHVRSHKRTDALRSLLRGDSWFYVRII